MVNSEEHVVRRKEDAKLERQQLEADLGELAWQDAERKFAEREVSLFYQYYIL